MKRVAVVLLACMVNCGCQNGVDTPPAAGPTAAGLKGPVANAAAFMERLRTQQDVVIGAIGQWISARA